MVLPKSMRLKGYRCFDNLYRQGARYHESSMLLRVVKAEPRLHKLKINQYRSQACRCAIAISSKVNKKAVIRNRLRRHLHDHLNKRLFRKKQYANNWVLLSLKPNSSNKPSAPLLEECDILLREAGLFS